MAKQETKPIAAIVSIAANIHDNGVSVKVEDQVAEQPAPKGDTVDNIGKRRQENEEKHAELAQKYALECILLARKRHDEEEKERQERI